MAASMFTDIPLFRLNPITKLRAFTNESSCFILNTRQYDYRNLSYNRTKITQVEQIQLALFLYLKKRKYKISALSYSAKLKFIFLSINHSLRCQTHRYLPMLPPALPLARRQPSNPSRPNLPLARFFACDGKFCCGTKQG